MDAFEWRHNIHKRYGIEPETATRERFLKGCAIKNDCWLWVRRGRFSIGRNTFRPQEMAYLMLKGPLAEDESATATCKNPKCCSPTHLVKDVPHKQFDQRFGSIRQIGIELAE